LTTQGIFLHAFVGYGTTQGLVALSCVGLAPKFTISPRTHTKFFCHTRSPSCTYWCAYNLWKTYSFSTGMDTTRGAPSANPAQAARDTRDEMKSMLKEIRAPNEEFTQALQTTPSLSLSQPTPRPQWHPSDPLVTERQI
jgi:hypothetical protein